MYHVINTYHFGFLQIASEKDENGHTSLMPILEARLDLSNQQQTTLQISYGNVIRPVFESVEYESLEKNTSWVRPGFKSVASKDGTGGDNVTSSNIVIPDTSNVRVLGPTPSTVEKSSSALKRKASSNDKGDSLAMVDR